MPTMPQHDLVILDVETTGLSPEKGDEVIEVAAQKLKGKEVVGEFVRLVKPTRPVPPETVAVHGITEEELAREGIDAAKVFPELREFIGDSIIIAHNAQFDVGFINAHFERLGLPKLENRVIDTLDISKKYLILASYKLSNCAQYLKVEQPSAHRALVDVITCREVFFRLIERAQGKK